MGMIKYSAKIDRIKDLFLSKLLCIFVLTHRNAARRKRWAAYRWPRKPKECRNILIHNGKNPKARFPFSAPHKSATYRNEVADFLFAQGENSWNPASDTKIIPKTCRLSLSQPNQNFFLCCIEHRSLYSFRCFFSHFLIFVQKYRLLSKGPNKIRYFLCAKIPPPPKNDL